MATEDKVSENLPRPGPIGRLVRILLGFVLLYFFANIVIQISAKPGGFLAARTGWRIPGGDWWVAALACAFVLPRLVNSGFGSKWGEWVRGVYLAFIGAAILWDRTAHDGLWAAPLAWLVLLLILYVFAHASVSFLVAGVAATPG